MVPPPKLGELDPNSPIQPDEILLRRVPKQGGMTPDGKAVLPNAFAPHSQIDTTGISVYRDSIHTSQQVAQEFRGRGTQPVWVAHIRASDVIAMGLTIQPNPLMAEETPLRPAQPGHALLPEINSGNARTDVTVERKRQLAAKVFHIDGPYVPPPP